MNFDISKERMLEGMHTMNSFGTRLTGSKGHNDFIKWIKEEINKIAAEISEKQNEIIENPDKFIQNLVNLKEDVKESAKLKKELKELCKENLAVYSVPKEFEFRDNLPLTKVGKVAYTVLEKEEMSNNGK